jgi:hypothetical protein
MFEVFKKYVIKNDRKLIPFLDDIHAIKIKNSETNRVGKKDSKKGNLKNYKRKKILDMYETIQLPHKITSIELNDLFVFIIDKYKNQKGINTNRYFYVLSKLHYDFIEGHIAYNVGLMLVTVLMGLECAEPDISKPDYSLNRYQIKTRKNIAVLNGKIYLLYKMQTIKDLGIKGSDMFMIINKKKLKKFKVEKKVFNDQKYFKTVTQPYLNQLLDDIFLCINYAKIQDLKNELK